MAELEQEVGELQVEKRHDRGAMTRLQRQVAALEADLAKARSNPEAEARRRLEYELTNYIRNVLRNHPKGIQMPKVPGAVVFGGGGCGSVVGRRLWRCI